MDEKIGLGGGCHWCTEAVFQSLPGVSKVEQGYIKAVAPFDTWSEAVIVHLSPEIDLKFLIDVHLETHNSTSQHSRREEYRSAIYTFNEEQKCAIQKIIKELETSLLSRHIENKNPHFITQVLDFKDFKPSRISIQEYYRTRPDAPFCKRYILPKLKKVQEMVKANHT